ncbi:MAG: hypothetical protein IKZ19_10155 [Clostridia bacterium]|nr:hypothetical protein [Clostridia bacterium]
MKKKRLLLLIVGAVIVLAVSGGLYAIAGGEGTETDPLITKSYLEQVFQPSIDKLIDEAVAEAAKTESDKLDALVDDYKKQISDRIDEFNSETGNELDNATYVALLEDAISQRLMTVDVTVPTEADVFRTVTLTAGQTLACNEGAEFFLRSGSATCVSSLLNVPAGTLTDSGADLGRNVLYISPNAGCGLTATENASVFIRGGYTVK